MPEEYVEIGETIRKLENGKLQLISTSGFECDFDDDEDEDEEYSGLTPEKDLAKEKTA